MRAGIVLVLLAGVASAGPDLSPRQLSLSPRATALLGGELTVTLPDGTAQEPRDRRDGTLARTRDTERYTLDLDGLRLTMLAYETYASTGTDFKAGVTADLGPQGVARPKVQSLAVKAPLVAYEVVPEIPTSTLDTWTLVYAAYIAEPTATVQVLAFYIAADELPYANAWTSLARRVATSAVAGATPVDSKPREVRIANLAFAKPDGWAFGYLMRSDSIRIVIRKVVPLGTVGPWCTLVEGLDVDPTPADVRSIDDMLLGREAAWSEWTDRDGAVTRVILPRDSRRMDIVVTCRARDATELPEPRSIVRSLHVIAKNR